ncbi:MAG: chemotaxis protein CheW [Rhodoferax sp.]|uniref:chemotaxis protein CheW n=1 Tax=Rhodoferax sp. TaxID=50421 RepID=UPI003266C353
MANREALRELQTRLASRLQAARSEGLSVRWLAAHVGGARYLFPLAQCGEIFPWTPVQPAAYTQAWFMGVANLRGGLCGVVDLVRFMAPDRPAARNDAALSECSLLSFNAGMELNCALLVDQLSGLRGLDSFTTSAPAAEAAPPYFGPVHTDAAGLPWQEINLLSLSQLPSFLSISA